MLSLILTSILHNCGANNSYNTPVKPPVCRGEKRPPKGITFWFYILEHCQVRSFFGWLEEHWYIAPRLESDREHHDPCHIPTHDCSGITTEYPCRNCSGLTHHAVIAFFRDFPRSLSSKWVETEKILVAGFFNINMGNSLILTLSWKCFLETASRRDRLCWSLVWPQSWYRQHSVIMLNRPSLPSTNGEIGIEILPFIRHGSSEKVGYIVISI